MRGGDDVGGDRPHAGRHDHAISGASRRAARTSPRARRLAERVAVAEQQRRLGDHERLVAERGEASSISPLTRL